jgi:hypothetical protein
MMSEEKILTQEIAEQFLEDLEDQDWVDYKRVYFD